MGVNNELKLKIDWDKTVRLPIKYHQQQIITVVSLNWKVDIISHSTCRVLLLYWCE